MDKSICYLSDDFSKVSKDKYKPGTIIAPEALLNGKQIQAWVAKLKDEPKKFCTTSIYLLREVYLQRIPCIFVMFIDGQHFKGTDEFDELMPLEILDRELEQADRYMDHELILQHEEEDDFGDGLIENDYDPDMDQDLPDDYDPDMPSETVDLEVQMFPPAGTVNFVLTSQQKSIPPRDPNSKIKELPLAGFDLATMMEKPKK